MEENQVIDTSLLIEGKTGLTTAFNAVEYPKALERTGIEVLWPVKDDFLIAIAIMIDLLRVGKPIPAIDVLIAATCIRRGLTLATRDEHYMIVKSIRPELKISLAK